jgi:hypothetical protein
MFSDFWTFVVAVFWRWQSWLGGSGGGGAIVVLVALYQALWGKERMPKRMYALVFVGGFLFFAFFMAWRDQYRRANTAEQTLALDKPIPAFEVKILALVTAPAGDKNNAVISAFAAIANLGVPSAISGFWLEAKYPDGRVLTANIASPGSQHFNVSFGKNLQGDEIVASAEEYWPNMMFSMMPQYGTKTGFIMGLLKGTTQKEIKEKHPIIVFTCIDPLGKRFSGERAFEGEDGVTPGITLKGLQHPLSLKH